MDEIWLRILTGINGGILVAVVGFGVKTVRFLSEIATKTELMWRDYEARMEDYRHAGNLRRRRTDSQ